MALQKCVINVDLADVWGKANRKDYKRTLAFGDEVKVRNVSDKHVEIQLWGFKEESDGSIRPFSTSGFIVPTKSSKIKPSQVVKPVDEDDVLKVDFVDVQQGDGTVIESPKGKVVLIDGGDNQLYARYLAGRYRRSSADKPKEIDCMLVSHGDADHFEGLARIFKSETEEFDEKSRWKRLFIYPKRVYHNGLVKRPGKKTVAGKRKSRPDREMFGTTKKKGKSTIITALEEDLLAVDTAKMNRPFRAWRKALERWAKHGPIDFRRLQAGDDDAFDFLRDEGIETEVLGPLVTKVGGKAGLKFLGNPPRGVHEVEEGDAPRFTGLSASHTVNGHSVILRMRYGQFRFLFAGDLNHEAEIHLRKKGAATLRSEVFKVPHHGSADFDKHFVKAVAPVVSVVSSGDESSRKEHIHPRATLIGALGRFSRVDEPIILVTEMVAFFNVEGYVAPQWHNMSASGAREAKKSGSNIVNIPKRGQFFAFSRTAFGIVMVRTNGKRLLVYTNSGQAKKKEVYAFTASKLGEMRPANVKRA